MIAIRSARWFVFVMLFPFFSAGADARQASPGSKPATSADAKAGGGPSQPTQNPPKIRFKPPVGIGSASNSIAGGTRGTARELVLFVAAPQQLGLTSLAQPELYWYVSRTLMFPPELLLVEVGSAQPLLERKLPLPSSAGFQRISLRDFGVELAEGRDYLWQVSLGSGGAGVQAGVIDASGRIRRVSVGPDLSGRINGADVMAVSAAYAEAGYWYDAVMNLRDAAGRTGAISEAEAGLFESAGLGALIRRAADRGP